MKTLPDGRIFPEYNGETLSWVLNSTGRDMQEGYPRLRAVIRAMKEYRPEQLRREQYEMLRDSFGSGFGNNARRVLAVIDEELAGTPNIMHL